jgi:hypothetical protein
VVDGIEDELELEELEEDDVVVTLVLVGRISDGIESEIVGSDGVEVVTGVLVVTSGTPRVVVSSLSVVVAGRLTGVVVVSVQKSSVNKLFSNVTSKRVKVA